MFTILNRKHHLERYLPVKVNTNILATLILELRLFFVYCKSFLFSRRFIIIPFVYKILFDLKKIRFLRLHISHRSDCFTIFDVFAYQNYSVSSKWQSYLDQYLRKTELKPIIVDLGANLGFSSLYFRQFFEDSYIVGVEPSDTAARLCTLHGVNEMCIGVIGTGTIAYLDDGFASYEKKISASGVPVEVISEKDLMASTTGYEPFILKVDIEGAEEVLFENYKDFVGKFKVIFVELHDWFNTERPHSLPLWNFLSNSQKEYNVLIRGDVLCLIKIG